jgi:hypothetical protein
VGEKRLSDTIDGEPQAHHIVRPNPMFRRRRNHHVIPAWRGDSSPSAGEVTGDVDPIDRARFGMKSAFAAFVRGTSASEIRPHRAYGAMEGNANSVVEKK